MAVPQVAAKTRMREEINARLSDLSEEARQTASKSACQLMASQESWRKAASVLLFVPLGKELNIWPLVEAALQETKTVALPQYDAATDVYCAGRVMDVSQDLRPGRFGIREPNERCARVPLNRLDLILVPGLAFDMHGHRLGRGRGFYDRLLRHVRGTTCGVAFDEQIVPVVPVDPHDSDVNCILTPTRWIEL